MVRREHGDRARSAHQLGGNGVCRSVRILSASESAHPASTVFGVIRLDVGHGEQCDTPKRQDGARFAPDEVLPKTRPVVANHLDRWRLNSV
jgi:hypothetical protein